MADEDVLVVATTGGKARIIGIDPLPANVRVEDFIPHAHLLPHVDVMVTNGGYGGTQMALAHGVLLVVSGHTDDKPEICERVAWRGAGIRLKRRFASPAAVRRAVDRVLKEPRYWRAAQRVQGELCTTMPRYERQP